MMKNQQKTNQSEKIKKEDFEAKQNLLGFFDLLLKIDKRNHPEKYKRNNKYDR
jgi:hypothetical protein